MLIAFRIVQGIGGGMMTPVGTAMLFRAFPPRERARAALILTVPTVIAPALGPIVGGWLVDAVELALDLLRQSCRSAWPACSSRCCLPEGAHRAGRGRLRLPGVRALGRGPRARALRALARPRARLDLARRCSARASSAWRASCCSSSSSCGRRTRCSTCGCSPTACSATRTSSSSRRWRACIGVLFLLPLFLQNLRGSLAVATGVILLPQAVGHDDLRRSSPAALPDRRTAAAAGAALASVRDQLGVAVCRIGARHERVVDRRRDVRARHRDGLHFIPLQAATFSTITPARLGRASSLFNTNRQVAPRSASRSSRPC